MSITSFDHFIETLENVPGELHRNFQLMQDLDRRGGEIIKRINDCVREYRNTDKKDDRQLLFKESMDLFDKVRSFADDKVDLAMQTYDLVDKHIRNLECLSGPQATTSESNTITNSSLQTNSKVSGHKKGGAQKGSSGNGGGAGGGGGKTSGGSGEDNSFLATEPALTVDMPLDPNEPKYCTCHQVSFGEMIACDNKDCPIEWFHFACVDLKSKPKGKWYCPECFNINKKGKHRFKRAKS